MGRFSIFFWSPVNIALSEVARVLREGGCFLISLEASDPELGKMWTERIDGMVVYTPAELEKRLHEAGFSSIMFDGSSYPIDENVAKTKELVKVCAEKGMSLEAEVGSIGGEEDGVIGAGECADPNECKMVADLGVTMLAAGIGNIHGKYPKNWAGLSFETLAAVQEKTGTMPLVLHGGTGIPEDMIKKAISLGVSKINVNTECQLAFQEATRAYIEAGKDLEGKGFDPRKLLAPGTEAIKATVKEKMELFGSVGKA